MPREVTRALKASGEWRGDGQPAAASGGGELMTAELGSFALVLALVLSLAQAGLVDRRAGARLGGAGRRRRGRGGGRLPGRGLRLRAP